jgi:hypothetical protein
MTSEQIGLGLGVVVIVLCCIGIVRGGWRHE